MTPATAGPDAIPVLRRSSCPVVGSVGPHDRVHRERHVDDRGGMVSARLRRACHDHVRIADRLDLLEAVPLGEQVERTEDLVQQGDDPSRLLASREGCERHDVREEDRHRVVVVGDVPVAALESVGDRAGQDVEQQRLGFRFGAHPLAIDEDDEAERDRCRNEEVDGTEDEPRRRGLGWRLPR